MHVSHPFIATRLCLIKTLWFYILLTGLAVADCQENLPATSEAISPLLVNTLKSNEINSTNEIADLHASQELIPPLKQGNSTGELTNNSTLPKKFNCLLNQSTAEDFSTFQLINGSTLLALLKHNSSITSRTQLASCNIILFYAPWCPFSIQAAPHLNALPRGFPMLKFYAIDAHANNSLSTLQGVMAIPSLFLFHNGKAAARYNETEYRVELFANFITRYTGIEPVGVLNRTSADYNGPLPTTVLERIDHWLIISWIILVISIVYWFTKSQLFWALVECIRNTWREAEAQHQHAD